MTSALLTADHRKNTIIAVLLTCIAYGFFNIGDAAIKILAQKFHPSQVIAVNAALIICMMCVYGWFKDGKKAFKVHNPKWIGIRSVFSLLVAIANNVAIPHVQLTTFYTLVFTSPFWIAVLSALFLGERLEKRRLAVIVFGFCVILYIMRPGGALFNVWSLVVLTSAFLYSCSMVCLRYLGARESRVMIICAGSALSVAASLPMLWFHFVPMNLFDFGMFFMMALVGAIGVMAITFAFQTAPSAAAIAPFHYTQMLWGALLGYYLFHEIPDMPTMVGAALLIGGGLSLIYLETRYPVPHQARYPVAEWFSRLRAFNPEPK